MTHEQIEGYRMRLAEILAKKDEHGKYKPEVNGELGQLALEVGACTEAVYPNSRKAAGRDTLWAETSELAYNIHQALQTASMVNMCETAAEGYRMARDATRTATRTWRVASAISFLSMLAAWAAVIVAWARAADP